MFNWQTTEEKIAEKLIEIENIFPLFCVNFFSPF